jgi:hypothetical protein
MMNLIKRYIIAVPLVLASVAMECSAAEYAEGADNFALFGNFRDDPHTGCIAAGVSKLTVGHPVTVVLLSKPQRLVHGSVTNKLASRCKEFKKTDQFGPFYEVSINGEKVEEGLGILIGKAISSTQTSDGRILATVDGTIYEFSDCTSSEAIHLMVRSAAKSKNTLVWHDHFYLGYDVDPTCSNNESAEMDLLNKSYNHDALKHAR